MKYLKRFNEEFITRDNPNKSWMDNMTEYDDFVDGVELKSWQDVHSNGPYVNFTFDQLKELSVFFGEVKILMSKNIHSHTFKMYLGGFGRPKKNITGIIYSHANCITLNLTIKVDGERESKWYKFKNIHTLIDFLTDMKD